MTQFVVDGNIAIKWVLPEIHSDIALKLLDDNWFFFFFDADRIRNSDRGGSSCL